MSDKILNIDYTEAFGYDLVPRGTKQENRPAFSNSHEVSAFCRNTYSPMAAIREEFFVLFLDRKNQLLGILPLSQGGIHGTVVDIRILFKAAINSLACGIILTHNHPSGNKQPSVQDDKITQQIKEAGKLLDILLLDHLIITDSSYYSYADEGKV